MFYLNQFSNDKYKVLKFLYDNEIKVKKDSYISLSQQEIADMLHYSKNKTNKYMQELKKENFIEMYRNMKGKYVITNQGYKVIKLMEKKYEK